MKTKTNTKKEIKRKTNKKIGLTKKVTKKITKTKKVIPKKSHTAQIAAGFISLLMILSTMVTPFNVGATVDTVTICHATDSNQNPYIVNHPAKTADLSGHNGHNGSIWFDGIAGAWGDIIPPFDYTDGSYLGKNWTTEGQAFYNNGCNIPSPSTTATIRATKIVCDNESDLPNLGGSNHTTASTTASNFLSSHPSCRPAPDWQFQWGTENTTNPGDNGTSTTPASGWTNFTSVTNSSGVATTSVTIDSTTDSHIWMREVLKPGYIGFTYNANSQSDSNNVSAEMYCSGSVPPLDGLHYDNYDRVDSPIAGNTYDCVAWNVATVPPAPTTGHIIVDKVTDPSQDQTSFHFNTDGTDYDAFDLADLDAFNDQTLASGDTYSVSEDTMTGWNSNGGICVSDQNQGATSTPSEINLHADETVTCTFTNTKEQDSGGDTVVTDPALVKTVDNGNPAPGAAIVYTLTVSNAASVDATNVTVSDPLPGSVTYVSDDAAVDADTTFDSGTNTLTWNIPSIPASGSVTLHVTATVKSDAAGSIANTASITHGADQGNSNTDNDSSTASVTVVTTTSTTSTTDSSGGGSGGGGSSSGGNTYGGLPINGSGQVAGASTGSASSGGAPTGVVLGVETEVPALPNAGRAADTTGDTFSVILLGLLGLSAMNGLMLKGKKQ